MNKRLTAAFLAILLVVNLTIGCTNSRGTKEYLETQGYTDIRTTGFDWFAHGQDDWTTTGFVAISPTGKTVKGAVSDKGVFAFLRPRMNIRIWSEK